MSNNMENLAKEYLVGIESQSTDNAMMQYNTVLRMCMDYERLIEKDFFTFNFNDFVQLFNYYNWGKENVFANRKSIIISFINYCISLNSVDKSLIYEIERLNSRDISHNVIFEKEYFKEFNDFYTFIVDKICGNDVEFMEKNSMTLATLILVWYGFNLDEIGFIENNDFNYFTGEVYCKRTNKKIIIEDKNARSLVNLAKNAEGIYRKMPTCKEECDMYIPYMSDKFLIKSIRNIKVSNVNLRNLISVFSRNIKQLDISDADYKRNLSYKSISTNGLYSRIYNTEIKLNTKIDFGKNILIFDNHLNGELLQGENPKSSRSNKTRILINEYRKWRKNFYGI